MEQPVPVAVHWFRKGLRLHDNPAFQRAVSYALQEKGIVRPIFILDKDLLRGYKVGANRFRFLVDCLHDLDVNLKKRGSRLYVLRGNVAQTLKKIISSWNVKIITFEHDTEPYAKQRDATIKEIAEEHEVKFEGFWSHTLYNPEVLLQKNKGEAPKTYQKFLDVMNKAGSPPASTKSEDIQKVNNGRKDRLISVEEYEIPTLEELKVEKSELGPKLYPGGESEAISRMKNVLSDRNFVINFAKPSTSPNSLNPSTTVLSPYLKFGCLSSRLFHESILSVKGIKTKPPVSLVGQLYWREFYYLVGSHTPNFTRISGNPICKQIPWDENDAYFQAWKSGRTGYPFIDAIMTQLRTEGWIHHLARHMVACFLTRGDLWLSWELGQQVFEEWLLDADVYLNAGNWMWLSASAFFHQFYRVYSPIAFGKKTDKDGEYIRKYLPILARYPSKYIYEPWLAPLPDQKAAGCLIGKDYPRRIVVHETISKTNITRMSAAYSADKKGPVKRKADD